MLLNVFDTITTVFQASLFIWMTNNIAYSYNKISKKKTYIAIALVFTEIFIFTHSVSNIPISNLLMVVGIIIIIGLFFRKSIIDAFLGFGVAYAIVAMTSYFLFTIYKSVFSNLNLGLSQEMQLIVFVYIPAWVVYFTVYKVRKYIFNAIIALKNTKNLLGFVFIVDYFIIFLDTVRMNWTNEPMGLMLKAIMYLFAFISLIFTIIYFAKINDKSKEVEMLNKALNEKIIELKKIKHDYGSEISGLYGLYQLGKYDRVGLLLKSIVERYQNLSDAVSVSEQTTPLIASVLHPASSAGINVIAFDSAEYENISISDNDLLKLLSNIVKNSMDILKDIDNPIIKLKSYNGHNGVSIAISNNGPKIPNDIKEKIFSSGFTTKDNQNGDRGYGLSIVKDIINSCNGEIAIESDKEWTTFRFLIPNKVV